MICVLCAFASANVCPDLLFQCVHLRLQGFYPVFEVLHFMLTLPQQVLIGLELICQPVKSLP